MADSLNRIMTKVAFTPKVPLVMKATSDDPTATPATLTNDIVNITYESLDHCENLMYFLVERLNKNSVHTKAKVLHLMKVILEKGHEEFAVGLRRNSEGIEKAKSFNRSEDPLHGKAFIHKVRENAQAVSELLFDVSRPKENLTGGGRIPSSSNTGFGSIPYSSHGATQSKQMQGFGNSNTNQPFQAEPGLLSDAQSILKGWKDTLVGVGPPSQQAMVSSSSADQNYHLHEEDSKSTVTRPSNTFTAFMDTNKPSSSVATPGTLTGFSPPPVQQPEIKPLPSNQTLPLEQTPEYRAISDLTSPGGIKVEPNKKDIESFIARCKTWDVSKVTEALKQCLESKNASYQIKALYVIENITTSVSGSDELKTSLNKSCFEYVSKMSNSNSKSTRDVAQKVLDHWNNQRKPPPIPLTQNIQGLASSNLSNNKKMASSAETSLLGLFDDCHPTNSPHQGGSSTQASQISVGSIMQEPANGSVLTPNNSITSTTDFFSGMQIHQAQLSNRNGTAQETVIPQKPSNQQLDLLGLDFDSSPAMSTTLAMHQQSVQQNDLSSMFTTMSRNQPQPSNQPLISPMTQQMQTSTQIPSLSSAGLNQIKTDNRSNQGISKTQSQTSSDLLNSNLLAFAGQNQSQIALDQNHYTTDNTSFMSNQPSSYQPQAFALNPTSSVKPPQIGVKHESSHINMRQPQQQQPQFGMKQQQQQSQFSMQQHKSLIGMQQQQPQIGMQHHQSLFAIQPQQLQPQFSMQQQQRQIGMQQQQSLSAMQQQPVMSGSQPKYSYGGNTPFSNPGMQQQPLQHSNYASLRQAQLNAPMQMQQQQPNQRQDFGFIGRSSGSGDAFDFVKDAMSASKTK